MVFHAWSVSFFQIHYRALKSYDACLSSEDEKLNNEVTSRSWIVLIVQVIDHPFSRVINQTTMIPIELSDITQSSGFFLS